MNEEYTVNLAAFNGPLDLLLHLIQKNRLNIHNIPMAELTRQYLDYIEKSRRLDVEVAGEFLLMASTLLRIKSRSILPKSEEVGAEEVLPEDAKEDPAKIESQEDLVKRLLVYKKFRLAGENLSRMAAAESRFVKREPERLPKKFLPPKVRSPKILFQVLLETGAGFGGKNRLKLETENFKVSDKMREILRGVKTSQEIKLSDVVQTGKATETIAAFLAALELVNRGKISARQDAPYEEIFLRG